MRRLAIFISISIMLLAGGLGQAERAHGAQLTGYFTLTLESHQIITANDMNGDEVYIVGSVVYTDHSGSEQACVFQTDQLSTNKRKGTITIDDANARPCGSLPVSDGVLVHLEVWDNDTWDPVVKEVAAELGGFALELGAEALLTYYQTGGTATGSGEAFAMLIEDAIGFFEQADRIYEVTLYYPPPQLFTKQVTTTTTAGCRAVGNWPLHSPEFFVEHSSYAKPPILSDSRLPLVWKQQATTFDATFSPKPLD